MKHGTVFILQRRLTHYRIPLFEGLRTELERAGITLRLVYGQAAPNEESKRDEASLGWAEKVTNRYWLLSGKHVCWQPISRDALGADLVIITQENSILSNYSWLLRRRAGGPRVAFWGHGANLQSKAPNGLRERFKRWTTQQVDWWFAYTSLSVDLVASTGFPPNRITNLENAVDTRGMRADIAAIGPADRAAFRSAMGWEDGKIAMFLGSLYVDKRLDFLFQAADRLHRDDPLFRLLIVGDGPLRETVRDYCIERRWCAWVGAKTGREKAPYLAVVDVLLNPGVVGLGILDAFVAGVPMVTTDCGLHSPEIAYLVQDENGLITDYSIDAFTLGVRHVLNDDAYRARLADGCRQAAGRYTIENMAKNFARGIEKAVYARH